MRSTTTRTSSTSSAQNVSCAGTSTASTRLSTIWKANWISSSACSMRCCRKTCCRFRCFCQLVGQVGLDERDGDVDAGADPKDGLLGWMRILILFGQELHALAEDAHDVKQVFRQHLIEHTDELIQFVFQLVESLVDAVDVPAQLTFWAELVELVLVVVDLIRVQLGLQEASQVGGEDWSAGLA